MVHIEVTGPAHSKRGYLMIELARVLRDAGCDVKLQGEESHLAEKASLSEDEIKTKLQGMSILITELQTR